MHFQFAVKIAEVRDSAAGLAGIEKRQRITGINPTNNGRAKIYSVDTSAGIVTNTPGEEIGEILICQDFQTYPPEMNLLPVYYEITIDNKLSESVLDKFILPLSLQILIENAVKHNITSTNKPLKVTLTEQNNFIVVSNNLQKKNPSLHKSLPNGLFH